MVIIGENLKGLIQSQKICVPELFDEFSISIRLDKCIFRLSSEEENPLPIQYNITNVEKYYQKEDLSDKLLLKSGESVLACSHHEFSMPHRYMGFLQTKGTLARLFVSAHCTDSHIEPGFTGKITLEITNHSRFDIEIPVNSVVAQLFIMRCSTTAEHPYEGKYANSQVPTIPKIL